jgi:hypothetical protein
MKLFQTRREQIDRIAEELHLTEEEATWTSSNNVGDVCIKEAASLRARLTGCLNQLQALLLDSEYDQGTDQERTAREFLRTNLPLLERTRFELRTIAAFPKAFMTNARVYDGALIERFFPGSILQFETHETITHMVQEVSDMDKGISRNAALKERLLAKQQLNEGEEER